MYGDDNENVRSFIVGFLRSFDCTVDLHNTFTAGVQCCIHRIVCQRNSPEALCLGAAVKGSAHTHTHGPSSDGPARGNV